MKFDFAIGNPPYQEDRQGESNTALPVYHDFMDAAYQVADSVELITPARFLFNAGRTPKEWNKKMLKDKHLKVLEYENNASKIFPNTDIKGGVAITYRSISEDYGAIETFTTHKEVNKILKKITPLSESVANICFVASKFNIENLFKDFPDYIGHERRMSSNVLKFNCFKNVKNENDITIFGVEKGKRIRKFIEKKYVDLSDGSINMYKVATPKADGSGKFGDTLTNPVILLPGEGFTHTFLGIGKFNSESEAIAALKYIKTKFTRTLLSILKITQDLNADKWKYVPLQDFSDESDIDWSKSIKEIDRQLYKKYGLTQEEIDFIESNVKEME